MPDALEAALAGNRELLRLLAQAVCDDVLLRTAADGLRSALARVPEPLASPAHSRRLDEAGVELWNATLHRRDDLAPPSLAALRFAAATLVLCGCPEACDARDSARVLGLLLKAVDALLLAGLHAEAEEALAKAASLVSELESPDGVGDLPRSDSTLVLHFYASRAALARRQAKLPVADFALNKAFAARCLDGAKPAEVAGLIAAAIELSDAHRQAASVAKDAAVKARGVAAAMQWARTAIRQLDRMARTDELDRLCELAVDRVILGALESMQADDLEAATVCLDSVLMRDPGSMLRHRQMVRLQVRRRVPSAAIGESLCAALDAISDASSEDDVDRLLQEIQHLPPGSESDRCAILLQMLERALVRDSTRQVAPRILFALVRVVNEASFAMLVEALRLVGDAVPAIDLGETIEVALHGVLWRHANRHADAGRIDDAVRWLELAVLRPPFGNAASCDKALRKLALCHLRRHDFAAADDTLRRCADAAAAPTAYVRFLLAVLRGDEQPAIRELQALVDAPDLRAEMLMWAVQQASESGLPLVLQHTMAALLDVSRALGDKTATVDELFLERCALRLSLDNESVVEPAQRAAGLLKQLQAAADIVEDRLARPQADFASDVAWLARTAYTTLAAQHAEWPDALVVDFADATARLLDAHLALSPDVAALAARLAQVRMLAIKTAAKASDAGDALARIAALRAALPPNHFVDLSAVARIEFKAALAGLDVDGAHRVVQGLAHLADAKKQAKLLQSLAHTLWLAQATLAFDTFFDLMAAILNAMLNARSLDTAALARWLRILVEACIAAGDDAKALEQATAALGLLRSQRAAYPPDEAQFLVAYGWELGIDASLGGDLEGAQAWCGLALEACAVAPAAAGSQPGTLEQMHAVYRTLTAKRSRLATIPE